MYGIPESELRRRLTSRDVTKLLAADNLGLIPEPWLQTGMICATVANVNRSEKSKALRPEDFLMKRVRRQQFDDAALLRGYEQRKASRGNG